ncbi:hypothetical protein DPMN_057436 [Dreissena polymorpha]|uniref:Uncharacterized protein n=1 Tax=Dreissena polymorpha TaxID=45954 RepID=A0A9D4HE54_DREPO|nr:hypothetical protein DPMN_057436 [Dreissena polymorpha]
MRAKLLINVDFNEQFWQMIANGGFASEGIKAKHLCRFLRGSFNRHRVSKLSKTLTLMAFRPRWWKLFGNEDLRATLGGIR